MKTGIELITEERREQIEKHHIAIQDDVKNNGYYQLIDGAIGLLMTPMVVKVERYPDGWNEEKWTKMRSKSLKERIIIAAALLAVEIDRQQAEGA